MDTSKNNNFLNYKEAQNNVADNKRDKRIYHNQYWLVNKKQDLWIGFFDGKQIEIKGGVYLGVSDNTFRSQQVIRIRKNNRISQFLWATESQDGVKYPLDCLNTTDFILTDKPDYLLFYSACTFEDLQRNSHKHEGRYDLLLYDKTYDTIIKVDGFPYSVTERNAVFQPDSFEKVNDYYVYRSSGGIAFKIIGKDKAVIIDYDTGKPQPKVPDTDPSTGKTIMVDDPEGFQPNFLERLPEVNTNK
ncbi:hypothetical protein C9426_34690 [Serratia sp. S1B]|nr:hypothetical protein C9426_34690 [Serratia sp. S1B]